MTAGGSCGHHPKEPLTSGPLCCGPTKIRANKDCATGAFGAACAASGNIYRCRRAGRFLFTLPAPPPASSVETGDGFGPPPLSLAYIARRAPVEKKRFEGKMIDVGRCSSRGVLGGKGSARFFGLHRPVGGRVATPLLRSRRRPLENVFLSDHSFITFIRMSLDFQG